MTEEQLAVYNAMMFGLVGDYIESQKFVINKNLITQRRPQAWMVDNAFSGIFQNVPQFVAQATSPMPVQGQGVNIADIMKALLSANDTDSSVSKPTADSVVIGGETYQKV